MILITGATGRIGQRVVSELVAAGQPVRAMSRTPEKATLPSSVEIVAGDFTAPESIDVALGGVDTVFLLWTAAPTTAPDVITRMASRAKRIVLMTSPHQTPHPFFQQPNPMAKMHAELERLVATSGAAPTFIRPGMFASNVIHWWGPAIRSGAPVRWPYAGAETAPIDERDIARAIAHVLTDDRHAGADYVLTGPEAVSHRDQVRIIGDALGRVIPFEELTPDEFRQSTAGVWPPMLVEMLLTAWAATMGVPAYVSHAVGEITGTPARTFRQWADDHVAAFR